MNKNIESSPSGEVVSRKRKVIFDIILIAVLLIAALSVVIILKESMVPGYVVRVSVNGDTVAEYPLSENGEFPIEGGKNILVIKDGYAYVSYADCPDGLCVKMGRISKIGERIVCLPNRVIVEIP